MKRKLFILILLVAVLFFSNGFSANPSTEKNYNKEYYHNGTLKAEGWVVGTTKTDYWFFYHPNGKIAAEGHFSNNKKEGYWHFYDTKGRTTKEGHYTSGIAQDWWIFYDIASQTEQRFQYKNNKKNGYALIYKKKRLQRAERYVNNTKTGEWTSIISFKRDNPDVSL